LLGLVHVLRSMFDEDRNRSNPPLPTPCVVHESSYIPSDDIRVSSRRTDTPLLASTGRAQKQEKPMVLRYGSFHSLPESLPEAQMLEDRAWRPSFRWGLALVIVVLVSPLALVWHPVSGDGGQRQRVMQQDEQMSSSTPVRPHLQFKCVLPACSRTFRSESDEGVAAGSVAYLLATVARDRGGGGHNTDGSRRRRTAEPNRPSVRFCCNSAATQRDRGVHHHGIGRSAGRYGGNTRRTAAPLVCSTPVQHTTGNRVSHVQTNPSVHTGRPKEGVHTVVTSLASLVPRSQNRVHTYTYIGFTLPLRVPWCPAAPHPPGSILVWGFWSCVF